MEATTTSSSRGQVVIPAQIRARLKIKAGDQWSVSPTLLGDLLLRRLQRPRRPLVAHLRRLRGIEIAPDDSSLGPVRIK
jgi:AbrB family looped-hinge helix DNA binding protein